MEKRMNAENLSAIFIKQEHLIQQFPVERGYFRSKLIVTDAFSNPIIAAASPLISILERIQIATKLPDLDTLHHDITHEFKAFYSRFHMHHYSEEFHFLANYLLCATTDEILGKSYLRMEGEEKFFKAFTPVSHNNIGPEQYFFDITNYIMTLPEQFLDIIELSYFCLMIGFEGKYHLQTDGRNTLDNLIENLFQTIQKLRTNKKHKLFKNYVLKNQLQKTKISTKKITLIILASIISIGIGCQFYINYQTKEILMNHVAFMENMP